MGYKKEWVSPTMEMVKFAANEYVAACGDIELGTGAWDSVVVKAAFNTRTDKDKNGNPQEVIYGSFETADGKTYTTADGFIGDGCQYDAGNGQYADEGYHYHFKKNTVARS